MSSTNLQVNISILEMHVTHVCNLRCESCSHFSNHLHRGRVEIDEVAEWFDAWSKRISMRRFNLLGGEPTIHPDLAKFVPLVRRHWPLTRIVISSNGFFLDRHPSLPTVLAEAGNASLRISVHHSSPEYAARLRPVFNLLEKWRREQKLFDVRIVPSFIHWTRRYKGHGETMEPFEDKDPRRSWLACQARDCKQLFEGKLWKCAPIAYLQLQSKQIKLSNNWSPYLKYKPLEIDCTDEELQSFAASEEEAICSMCPVQPQHFRFPNPLPSRNEPH
jgi:radical SAM family protein